MTRKWNIVNNNSKSNYDTRNKITQNTEVLKPNLSDQHDAQILVKGNITAIAVLQTQVSFKNCEPFIK